MIKTGTPYQDNFNYAEYYSHTLEQCDCENIDLKVSNHPLEIYITAFDSYVYVKYQIKTLKHFLNNISFRIIIADTNSHINPIDSSKIKQLCIKENVGYIKMPHNKMQDIGDFSSKLGVDMTWLWLNVIKHRQSQYFGFLDVDCFLIKHIWVYLKQYLDNKQMYGLSWEHTEKVDEDGKHFWLCHIMANFFKYDFVKDKDLDFRPAGHLGLDTGGCNYFTLFKERNREDYAQTESHLINFVGKEYNEVFRDFSLHDHERWLHVRNATKVLSGHPKEKEWKEVYMTGILNGIILKSKL